MSEVTRRWTLQHGLAAGFASVDSPICAQSAENDLTLDERKALVRAAGAYMKTYEVPGLSVAIARQGRLAYVESFGVADTSTGELVTTSHLFRIASVSKPITSVGVFTLVEQGKLKLSDKIFGLNGILGSAFDVPRETNLTDITVGYLLTHLSGGWSNGPNDPMSAHKEKNHKELISWTLANYPLAYQPGTRFLYSNFGYCLLGRVIERISGKSYSEYIRDAVLAPCGITTMRIAGNTRAERAEKEVVYYHRTFNPYAINMKRNDATGGWLASAKDLATFAMHVDGFSHSPNILQPATIKSMTTPTAVNPHYAHGWAVLKGNWRHDGSLPGTSSTIVRTQTGYCWAALTNSSKKGSNRGLDRMIWTMVSLVGHWTTGGRPQRPGEH